MWSFSSYLGRAQPPPSFRFHGVSGHRGENCSAGGPSSSCLRGCFHARSLSPLSSSELVLAVLCDTPVLSLLVSRTPQVCGCSPLLAPQGACPGLPAGALQPVRPSSPGWLSSLRPPGSAVLRLVGCWSQKDPPPPPLSRLLSWHFPRKERAQHTYLPPAQPSELWSSEAENTPGGR